MNLKEAIELIDPEIKRELKCEDKSQCSYGCGFKLKGRLSQMKREVERLNKLEGNGIYEVFVIKEYIEALNILINHLEEVLKWKIQIND